MLCDLSAVDSMNPPPPCPNGDPVFASSESETIKFGPFYILAKWRVKNMVSVGMVGGRESPVCMCFVPGTIRRCNFRGQVWFIALLNA